MAASVAHARQSAPPEHDRDTLYASHGPSGAKPDPCVATRVRLPARWATLHVMKIQPARVCVVWVACLLAGLAVPAAADIFSWIDEAGIPHFSDQPPPPHLRGPAEAATETGAPMVARIHPKSAYERSLDTGSGRVTIYTDAACAACAAAKQYFRDHQISYTEYNVSASPTARNEVEIMQAQALPVILVREQRMDGFSAPAFDQIWHGDAPRLPPSRSALAQAAAQPD